MTHFKKTNTRNYAKASAYINTDTQYWKNYEFPVTVKEFTTIDYIDVCPVEPHYIAVSTGPKVDIYHQQTAQVWQCLSVFSKLAYGGKFRRDGQLLIAGSEDAHIRLFNFKQKQMLRVFKGHSGPVHRVDFVSGSTPQVVSFSDDKTVCLWDILDEKKIMTFDEHTDFIRAGISSPSSEHVIISGSYDHTIKVWDTRTGSSVVTLQHGAPVQDVICYPTGSVIASAGGTEVKVFDIVGGKLLSSLSQHHKTITCLSLASRNTRLLSGSLDRHVKVYEVSTYNTLHSMDYPAPILSLGVAPNDSTIITGQLSGNSGLISFEHKSTKELKTSSLDSLETKKSKKFKFKGLKIMPGDEFVTHTERPKMAVFDRHLSRFQFNKAFDLVLQAGHSSKSPHVTVAVLRELIRRGGLATALAGRDAKSLIPLFRFLTKNIRNPTFHRILIQVTNVLLDIYENSVGEDPKLFGLISRLNEEIEKDLLFSKSGINMMGAIEMFWAASKPRDQIQQNIDLASSNLNNSFTTQHVSTVEESLNIKEVVDIC